MSKYLFKDKPALLQRDLSNLKADQAAVNAMVQAAVNVELFTIPLYMTSLYSVHGMHQINGSGNNYYQGRLWPGLSTTRKTDTPLTTNQDVFNKVFSVFIAEMLHLQLASNICTAVGYTPSFTSPLLQNEDHSWICYGENNTVIPHVLDLKDVNQDSEFYGLKVKLDSMNATQVKLFLAIEETEYNAEQNVDPEIWKSKYSPTVPYPGWTASNTEKDLPLFGTIGQMYMCLWEYLSIQYTDGQTLWDKMYDKNAIQQDIFNTAAPQYPNMSVQIDTSSPVPPQLQVLNMINGITDQGEGSGVVDDIIKRLRVQMPLKVVENQYQPDEANIAKNYPSYTDTGIALPTSADATARGGVNGGMDHFEIFQAVQQLIQKPDFLTWDQWHQTNKTWQASDLIKDQADYETNLKNYPQLPTADQIVTAMNNLTPADQTVWNKNYELFSQIATGSITGMTTVLDKYWMSADAKFPMPAMSGTADRMSICWALFGKAPDLSIAPPVKKDNVLYHACQGMALDKNTPSQDWGCASPAIYHTCIGSNGCRSEGGCGFVQATTGGGSCGGSGCGQKTLRSQSNVLCGQKVYSAPADNKCGALGGCAVPISASQMYPTPKGPMEFFNFTQNPDGTWNNVPLPEQYPYKEGQLVHDVAWDAYTAVLKARQQPVPDKPTPNDIRLAFPPST
ncbi:Ferritin-like protein [compost metagenome]